MRASGFYGAAGWLLLVRATTDLSRRRLGFENDPDPKAGQRIDTSNQRIDTSNMPTRGLSDMANSALRFLSQPFLFFCCLTTRSLPHRLNALCSDTKTQG